MYNEHTSTVLPSVILAVTSELPSASSPVSLVEPPTFRSRIRHRFSRSLQHCSGRRTLFQSLHLARSHYPFERFDERIIINNSNSNSYLQLHILSYPPQHKRTGLYHSKPNKCKPTGSSHIPSSAMVAEFGAVVSCLHRRIPCPIGWSQELKEVPYGNLRSQPEK